jgi:hypothetical protein
MHVEGLGGMEECKPSWRPSPNRLRVHLGVQEQSILNWMPKPHTEFDLDILYMVGTIIS